MNNKVFILIIFGGQDAHPHFLYKFYIQSLFMINLSCSYNNKPNLDDSRFKNKVQLTVLHNM